MMISSLYGTYKRYRTLQTDRITSLPVVILMPHSACNCRCVMCDIWKGNHNLKQLSEADITGLMDVLKKYETKQVLMSGGEALLNPNFFRFCEMLKKENISISLLSTGLTIRRHAAQLVKWVNDITVSLDGDELLHDEIRNLPGAFWKMREGIEAIRLIAPGFKIKGRSVIHRLNYRRWPMVIETAKAIGLNSISFFPADVSSNAFNRETAWTEDRQQEVLPAENELLSLAATAEKIINNYSEDFLTGFIVEPPAKIRLLVQYYAAQYGLACFPYKKCNAPWVSTVIEADGTVRPCFFHDALGNIKTHSLDAIINSESAVAFRKNLDVEKNETCLKCVCYLHLSPGARL